MELIPKPFFSPILCRLFNVIFWGGDALGRKHQLLKDKGVIIIRIKSPLKEESQIERSFFSIYCAMHPLIKAGEEREEAPIILPSH